MTLPQIISVVFFVTCEIYFFFALLVISYNTKSRTHWLLYCCCLAMSVWAFSFAMGNVAADYETCLIWRRVGSIGWGTVFSFFLHFMMSLTGNKWVKSKLMLVIIYIPALVNVFLYGAYTDTAVRSYNLFLAESGWVNIAANTLLDWYYNIYYIGYSLAAIVLLLRWGFYSKENGTRHQALLIGGSFLIAVILGTLTEYIINHYFLSKTPQIASIIILIPVSVMLFCTKRYGFMGENTKSLEPEEDEVLSEYTKSKLYFFLSITYVIAAFVNFSVMFYSGRGEIARTFACSGIIFSFGVLINVIQRLNLTMKLQQRIANSVLILSIPTITAIYYDASALYGWTVPVILMLVAIAFNQRKMLIHIGVVTLLTCVWLWFKAPVATVEFSAPDHISRVIILIIIMFFVLHINHIYIDIITINRNKARQERLLNQLSNLFLTTNETNVNDVVVEAMSLCGKHFKLNRVMLMFLPTKLSRGSQNNFYEWSAGGMSSICQSSENAYLEKLLLISDPDRLETDGTVYVYNAKTSAPGSVEQAINEIGLKSLVAWPLTDGSRSVGMLCLGSAGQLKWGREQREIITLIAHMISDVWAKVEADRELFYQANFDLLTGLPNRSTYISVLSRSIIEAENAKKLLGVLFIDVDSFKAINDSVGHSNGDSVLIQIGALLKSSVSSSDIVARFGGDEFLVMISESDTLDRIYEVAEKIMENFWTPFLINNQEFRITVSAGISVYPYDGKNPETLIKNADLAMYRSKQGGKSQYAFCTEDLKRENERRTRLSEDLFRALRRNDFRVYYQPQVDVFTKKIASAEALLRWIHPEFGLVMPSIFIPLAEQTGLIGPIGEWVLHEACRQCRELQLSGLDDLRIAVNVSVIQLRIPNFVARVSEILEETGLDPRYLELEVTESTTVSEPDRIIGVLDSLKKLGITIAIDDFGIEYSSLGRLCAMPIDSIKLDKQFVRSIGRGEKENAIIGGIIKLAHSLELKVIAEGVEAEFQYDFLVRYGADSIQGFYCYHPVPPEEFKNTLLAERKELVYFE